MVGDVFRIVLMIDFGFFVVLFIAQWKVNVGLDKIPGVKERL